MIDTISQLVNRHHSLAIRGAILLALIVALPLISFAMTKISPAFVVVGLALPFGVLAVVKRLELGLVAMLLAGFFIRFRIPTGTASEIVISLLVAGGCIAVWVIRMLVVDKRLSLKSTAVNLPLMGFMAVVVISWGWGRAFRDELVREAGHPLVSVVATFMMVLLPASLLLVANNVRNPRWLEVFVWVVLGEGLIVLVVDLGAEYYIGPMRSVARFLYTNRYIHLNSQGLLSTWCVALALSLVLFHKRLHPLMRYALVLYAGLWIYWGFVLRISWLSGWVPAFVAVGVIALLRSRQLFFVLLVIMLVGAGGYYFRTEFQSESERSGETRLEAYRVNWRITGKHLLFGTGPAGYASYYMSYFPTEAMASHSNYIDIIAQTGIVGSVLILWFFGAQAWGSYRIKRRLAGREDFDESLTVAVLGGTVGCVIAMALGDWLLPFTYTQGIPGFDLAMFNWFFMGSVWVLKQKLESESGEQKGQVGVEGASA